ncbi:MAG TPA: RNA methyltransferase [Kamptonema sp.]|nr:RNA methyltransferase [Kamptonema sp.]
MITSIQNPLVKEIRKLHESKGRREQGLFLLEGTHLLEEAIAQNYHLATVCCTVEWREKYLQLWEKVCLQAQRVELVSDRVLEAIATTVKPDGAIATASRSEIQSVTTASLGLALETIQDPGNLGTIIRTAAAAGADGLWVSKNSVDLDHPKVLRASAGAWFRLPMAVTSDLKAEVSRCQDRGMQILATLPNASLSYWEVDLRVPTLIVLGNEGAGLSEDLTNLASLQVRIPLSQGVESLNVAIAAALILYEAQRQRR